MKPGLSLRQTYRQELDRRDWSAYSRVSWDDLRAMSLDTANKLAFSGTWIADGTGVGLVNILHPDNAALAVQLDGLERDVADC
jgi:hypothetical protein